VPSTPAWKKARARLSAPEAARGKPPALAAAIQSPDRTILDLVDNLLNRGVLLRGELILGLADVDLVYLQLSVLLAAADRALGPHPALARRRPPARRSPPRRR
jgi:hypothetical protein